jgi:hypothetical protein
MACRHPARAKCYEDKNNMMVWLAVCVLMLLMNSMTCEISAEEYQFPDWVTKLIEKEKTGAVANPPASLSRCKYKGGAVYYLPPRCCDIPGVLYDENGIVICNPSGGLTGRGDGRCPDFFQEYEKRDCVVIWRDSRSWTPLQRR